MKVAQIVGPRRIEVVDTEEPQLASDAGGMVKVRVERSCLCGSDMPLFSYDLEALSDQRRGGLKGNAPLFDRVAGATYPLAPGQACHECVGTVSASTSSRFQEGDFVLAVPRGQAGLCEFFVTPEAQCVGLPRRGVSAEEILMAQPLGTVIWACQKLGNLLGQNAVVVGQGPMGLLISHALSNLGARTVVGMDKLDYRLDAARRMRATHTVNVEREDPVASVHEITGGKMADLVVEAAGHQTATIGLCTVLARRLGTVVAFGVPDQTLYGDFPYSEIVSKNLTLVGSIGPDMVPCYSLARDMISQGRMDVSPLITHVLPFTEVQRANELFADREDGAIKVVLDHGQTG